ncbi:MAG: nucleotide sugar dehydrogenase [Euryarchaeota archaeon]|nr:nucleotide sugar dehydrogenase [Euryarchaeota archaeon]
MIEPSIIDNRDLTIGIVGLGYVGLPTAIGFYEAGFRVIGLDISEDVINKLKRQENPSDDPTFNDQIPNCTRWEVSLEPSDVIPKCDVIIVTVPTPVDSGNLPNLSYVKNAGISIFDNLDIMKQPIIVLESTVYPGVTREVWLPLLEERGMEDGKHIHLAYCPERFVPGNPELGVRQVPRVVGASNEKIAEHLAQLYRTLTEGGVIPVSSIEVAEASKVVENVQRDLNIALVNELALILPEMGLDVEEVLDAAATKWNFHRYSPGIGVGGHCIPVDPYYLIQKATDAGAPVDLISSARMVNANMPIQVAKKIIQTTENLTENIDGLRVLILGWAYKPGISDTRETPALPLSEIFNRAGFEVFAWDPYISNNQNLESATFVSSPFDIDNDIVVLCTAHPEILQIDWQKLRKKSNLGLLYDGRRVLNEKKLEQIGWIFTAVGKP